MKKSIAKKYKPYPVYKDSGVEWLGAIPQGWRATRLKYLVRMNPETLPEDTDPNYEVKYVEIGGIDGKGEIETFIETTFESSPSRARRIVRNNDIIISTVRTYLRAIARITTQESNWVVSTGFAVIRCSDVFLSQYCTYAMNAPFFIEKVVANSTGVSYPAINESLMSCFKIAYPEVPIQNKIAFFLDRETAKLDALLAKYQRLLELLAEKRSALITCAVTKGLDPDAPMKDSGVEWLGEIPATWKREKIKHVSIVKRGASPRPIDDPIYFDENGEYSWVRISDVTASNRYLIETEQTLSNLGASLSVKLGPGNIFVSIAATIGKPIITKIKCCIHDGFVYFPMLKESVDFFHYLFSSSGIYKGLGKWGTQLNLNTETFGNITAPIPEIVIRIE